MNKSLLLAAMPAGPAAQASPGDPLFDNVFVKPSSYRTMFLLEIRRSTGKGSINNGGHYQGEVTSVEAAVKDEKRFRQEWVYFGFGRGAKGTLNQRGTEAH